MTHALPPSRFLERTLHEFPDFFPSPELKGEGDRTATGVVGAAGWTQAFLEDAANYSGPPPPIGSGHKPRLARQDPVRKRSFRRACRRAYLDQFTWYKGAIWKFTDFPTYLQECVKQPARALVHRPVHSDASALLSILKTHGLCALNTWSGKNGPTYCHGTAASRIDYFFARLSCCDGQSKQVQYLPTADVVPLATTFHVPMICSFLKLNLQYQKTQLPGSTFGQRIRSRIASMQDLPAWRDFVHSSTQALQHVLDETTSPNIDTLNCALTPHFHAAFPTTSTRAAVSGLAPSIILHKWQVKSKLRRLSGNDLATCFQAWRLAAHYLALKRVQQVEAKLDRRRRFDELCQDVATAAHTHDAFGMFQVINKHTPRRLTQRVRLPTAEGQIADQYTAHDILVKFVQTHWHGPLDFCAGSTVSPGVPFTEQDLVHAMIKIPTGSWLFTWCGR
eukprot:s1098_g9.t1